MSSLLWVGAGGFAGSILRFLLSGAAQAALPASTFPVGTLVVNATGCFAAGFLAQLAEARGALGPEARLFVIVGLLGGYTTFSAFGNETIGLLNDGQRLPAAANLLGNLLLALGGVWLGRLTAHSIWS